jgi:predicted ATPase/DNA-binding winged helix-turn-helix (wHTH) protein
VCAQVQPPVDKAKSWSLNMERRELLANGTQVPVGGREFDIIEVLAQSAGALVTKGDLMARVWPGVTVEENTLQVHISAVRRAFGPDRGMLRTASGRGYRLLGDWTIRRKDSPPVAANFQPAPFPSQRSRTNLPAATSELIGRGCAGRELRNLMCAHRIVTLIGPGGIGKTRLALEVARRLSPCFPEGIWLVELVSQSEPDLVPSAVAAILGLEVGADEISSSSVARAIGERRILLVLDNCEHVVAAVARLVEAVVQLCPNTSILATSRELLDIDGERASWVPPLGVPSEEPLDSVDIREYSAVQLFIARTLASRSGFSPDNEDLSSIGAICRRLDGIPLAIEFAAARAATLGVKQVLSGLDDRFTLLTQGQRTAPPRHETLRATLDWSYQLLTEAEQQALRRLAILAAGFPLEAGSAVMLGAVPSVRATIANLVARSLVALDGSETAGRWRLLETIRAYALEKLVESGEFQSVARRHAEYCRDLLKRVVGKPLVGQLRCIDDVRAALDWAFSPEGDTSIGVALTVAAAPLWLGLSLLAEGRRHAERALLSIVPGSKQGARREMELLAAFETSGFGTSTLFTENGRVYAAVWTKVLHLAEILDDPGYQLRALWGLWSYRISYGEYRAALAVAKQYQTVAAANALVSDPLIHERMIGVAQHFLGDQVDARRRIERMLDHGDIPDCQYHTMLLPIDQRVAAHAYLARIHWLQGRAEEAVRTARASVEEGRALDHPQSLCFALTMAGCPVALYVGDQAAAERSVSMLIDHSARHALALWHAWGRGFQGILMSRRGDAVAGLKLLRGALDELRETGFSYLGLLMELARVLSDSGLVADGLAVVDEALALSERTEERWCVAELLRIKGDLVLLDGSGNDGPTAESHFTDSLEWSRRQAVIAWELRTSISLAHLRRSQGRTREARRLLVSVCARCTRGFETEDLLAAKQFLEESA